MSKIRATYKIVLAWGLMILFATMFVEPSRAFMIALGTFLLTWVCFAVYLSIELCDVLEKRIDDLTRFLKYSKEVNDLLSEQSRNKKNE